MKFIVSSVKWCKIVSNSIIIIVSTHVVYLCMPGLACVYALAHGCWSYGIYRICRCFHSAIIFHIFAKHCSRNFYFFLNVCRNLYVCWYVYSLTLSLNAFPLLNGFAMESDISIILVHCVFRLPQIYGLF